MRTGKLHSNGGEEFVIGINYDFHDDSTKGWWGEFILREYKRVEDGDDYTIELKDGRKGKCSIKKRVNRAVTGVPPLYRYYFKGSGPLK